MATAPAPSSTTGHHGGAAATVRAKGRVIDIHTHLSVPAASELVAPFKTAESEPAQHFTSAASRAINHAQIPCLREPLTSPARRLKDMDALGIDVQVLSPAPLQYHYWAEPDLGLESARLINDRVAEVVGETPDRFVGLGTLPLQAPELAVAELRRLVRDLGLKGVEISSNVAGAELSEPRFAPVFAAAEELGILVFIHPLGFTQGERISEHYLNNLIGNPLESAIAVAHLIFGGVLDRHPGLKICVAHGGGYLPTYIGRMDHAFHHREDCRGCRNAPSTYLKDMSFDTVVFDPDQLDYLVRKYGADKIVMGSDYPFDMAEPDPAGFVAKHTGLGDEAVDLILGGNAARLLGIAR
ncbi:amidohydrolase family protein [Acuticoccus kandeliae]|uniref:amidohydrolase family protein n=1 Tax=Acuticoccus kandeliae TaxID=2073160 RepID=UPI000D3E2574|nr:amidohydrolase family protein [Acuticoccus kandeliae]